MIKHGALWWPDTVGDTWKHSVAHLQSIEWGIAHALQHRTAVQAGGNIGLWPRRLAASFQRVITFEPDAISRECLRANVPASVDVRDEVLGDQSGMCDVKHRGLGSHRVVDGDRLTITTIDALGLTDLDYLQLDVEGYEWHALQGAMETIARCRPLIQVELRDHTTKYGRSDDQVRACLASWGYRQASEQPGSDVVFRWAA